MKRTLSKCCYAEVEVPYIENEVYVNYGKEGTNYYICSACNQPCDVYYPECPNCINGYTFDESGSGLCNVPCPVCSKS